MKTGFALQWIIGSIDGKAVCEGTRISSPGFKPIAWCNRNTPAVQFAHSTACLVPVCLASSDSNASHSLDRMYQPDSSARIAACLASSSMKQRDNGIFVMILHSPGTSRCVTLQFSRRSRKYELQAVC